MATEPLRLPLLEGQTLVLLAKADPQFTRVTLELEPRTAKETRASMEAFTQGRKAAEASFTEAYRLEPALGIEDLRTSTSARMIRVDNGTDNVFQNNRFSIGNGQPPRCRDISPDPTTNRFLPEGSCIVTQN